MDSNDYELIYLYREEFVDNAKNLLYKKYCKEITRVQSWVFNKYHSLPIELHDLDSVNYWAFVISLDTYNQWYNKSFHSFLMQNEIWELHNYIHRFLSKKQSMMNMAVPYDDEICLASMFGDNGQRDFAHVYKQELFLQNFKKLSIKEQRIFLLKRAGKSYCEIANALNISSKAVDNALQKIIIKFKMLWIQNHV